MKNKSKVSMWEFGKNSDQYKAFKDVVVSI